MTISYMITPCQHHFNHWQMHLKDIYHHHPNHYHFNTEILLSAAASSSYRHHLNNYCNHHP